MSNVIIERESLDSLAEVIGAKSETGVPLTLEGMRDAVLGIETGITPTGTKTITTNGTHDVTAYETASVNVPIPSMALESLTVTPSTEAQSITPSSGYAGFSEVDVEAIDQTSWVTPTIEVVPTISVGSQSGVVSATVASASHSVQPMQYGGWIDSDYKTVNVSYKSVTSQLTTLGSTTVTPSMTEQTVSSSGVFLTGTVKVAPIPVVETRNSAGGATFTIGASA